jgi:hypothetical protein
LQCPSAGHCIDYPSRVDLSQVLGSTTGDVAVPALDQIVSKAHHHKIEWWRAVFVWVKSSRAWAKIARAKSDDAMDACEKRGHCSKEYQSNIFLYFNVVPEDPGPDTPNA